MPLDPVACYRALCARDRRFDGLFFTCVRSTGIYCRPICPAGPPKFEHCHFVESAAAAMEAGYRPCLRCRPDTAPDSPAWNGTSATVSRALRLIDAGLLDTATVGELANRLGVGERHLRRLFIDHLGASPLTVAMTRRLLLAKQLLHDSDLPMIDVAFASGFGSLRRFNEVFRSQFGRPPSRLRRHRRRDGGTGLHVLLPYRAPYAWECVLDFLRARALPGVEAVTDDTYSRTIRMGGATGWLSVTHAVPQRALRARIEVDDLAVVPLVVTRLKQIFDVSANPQAINGVLSTDTRLRPLVTRAPGLRVPGSWDLFELGVRAILGQQVTVSGATTLAGRLIARHGTPISITRPGLTHYFPRPTELANEPLDGLGLPGIRAATLSRFAHAIATDPLLSDDGAPADTIVERLLGVKGIGPWTANYIAMRALRLPDALPVGDVALIRALTRRGRQMSADALVARAHRWRPWRAYAVMHLWRAGAELPDAC